MAEGAQRGKLVKTNFLFSLFEKRWKNFDWKTVSHSNCWSYNDDRDALTKSILKDTHEATLFSPEEVQDIGNKISTIREIDTKATAYCSGCPSKFQQTTRIWGTNWWV